jgi:hypothetical protein
MGFNRIGPPGGDTIAHINTGGRRTGACRCARFPKDNPEYGEACGRLVAALCDAPAGMGTCDKPMCELHRTAHPKEVNIDYCPEHKHLVGQFWEEPKLSEGQQ